MTRRVAVIGGGWAGLAAAVEATTLGHAVTVFEMAPQLGGRARAVEIDGLVLDNGQHILIGAYTETLRLMATLGVDVDAAFLRTPLRIAYPDGAGLRLPPGAPIVAFTRGVLAHPRWHTAAKVALLRAAAGWAFARFRCDPRLTVAELTRDLPEVLCLDLIEPLCVAALNTPAAEASASVFLRVLRDALFVGSGSADLLLPRRDLSALLPAPAAGWLAARGAVLRLTQRVQAVESAGDGWSVEGEPFDRVIVAAPPAEAARLLQPHASAWAATALALRHEPIVTVYAHAASVSLPAPMLALAAGASAPAQFVFDRGQLGGPAGLLAFVISGAQPWVDRGTAATIAATMRQAADALGIALQPLRVLTEKRATFRCTPLLERPPMHVAPGLLAAGDHVAGPYPATLEGAVRAGVAAARAVGLPDRDGKFRHAKTPGTAAE